MNPVLSKYRVYVCLGLLCLVHLGYKLYLFDRMYIPDRNQEQNFFWSEAAFHYRHFKMIADGKEIPAIDRQIQYPEGIHTRLYNTPLMEYVTGSLYRNFFRQYPPHVFLVYFMLSFSCLNIIAVFMTAKAIWTSDEGSLFLAGCYAFLPGQFIRTIIGIYIKEVFALPFIFISFGCLMHCFKKDTYATSVIGALSLVTALIAWDVTQLYLTILACGLVVTFLITRGENFPIKNLFMTTFILLMAAVSLPELRVKYFAVSPPILLLIGMIVILLTVKYRERNTYGFYPLAIRIFLFLSIAALFTSGLDHSYSHAYQLVLYKIMYGGVLPADADLLPFEAKIMWTGPFLSPQPVHYLINFLSVLIPGTVAVLLLIKKIADKSAGKEEILITCLSLTFCILFTLILRMSVFTAFFSVLPIGVYHAIARRTLKHVIAGGISLLLLIHNLVLPGFHITPSIPDGKYLDQLINYLRDETPPDAVFLTSYELGPSVAGYADRAVLIHSKFESKKLRDKVKEIYTALFSNEEDLHEIGARYGAGYVIYQNDMVLADYPGNIAYQVDRFPIRTHSPAFLMHFFPEELEHFNLVYRNHNYSVFQMDKNAETNTIRALYSPFNDIGFFYKNDEPMGNLDRDRIDRGVGEIFNPNVLLLKCGDLIRATRYQDALDLCEYIARTFGVTKDVDYHFAEIFIGLDDQMRLKETLYTMMNSDERRMVVHLPIHDEKIFLWLGAGALAHHDTGLALALYEKAVKVFSNSEELNFRLGLTCMKCNRLSEAGACFSKVLMLNPNNYTVLNNLGSIHGFQNDHGRARYYFKESLRINPEQPDIQKIVAELNR